MKVKMKVKEILCHEITVIMPYQEFQNLDGCDAGDIGDYMTPSSGNSKTIKSGYWEDADFCEVIENDNTKIYKED